MHTALAGTSQPQGEHMAKVYVLEIITGGVSNGPEVFASRKSAEARMLAEAKEWASCGDILSFSGGRVITPRQAVKLGAFTDINGDDDCILFTCEVTP